jgi:hypothetical protein
VDIYAKCQRHSILEMESQCAAALTQQRVSYPIALQGMIAFEEKQRLKRRIAGRIAITHSREIGASRHPNIGVGREHAVEYLPQQHRRRFFGTQPLRENVAQRVLDAID